VTICGSSVALPQILPPAGSGPVVLMAVPCIDSQAGDASIPQAYRRYIEPQPSRPADGLWIPYDATARQTMEADYRRLWNSGRFDDLNIKITDYTFSNAVIRKFVIYTAHER
jgi:hypothetical protein